MAVVVKAGEYVSANIQIENVGQQKGTFRVRAIVVPDGGTVEQVQQRFYNAVGYNASNPPPAGAEIATSTLTDPNAVATVQMFTDMWAGGDPLKYTTDQQFDVIFEIVVVETSEVFNFRGENVLQHQTLAPAKPNIVGVDYVISVTTGLYLQ